MKYRVLDGILTGVLFVLIMLIIEHGTNAVSGFREEAFGYGVMFVTIVILKQFSFFREPKSLSELIAEKENKK